MVSEGKARTPGEEFETALEGLTGTLGAPEAVEASLLALLLERLGDVLRLGAPPPDALRAWCRALGQEALRGAVGIVAREVKGWPRPAPVVAGGEAIAPVIRRRDAVESAMVALSWIRLAHGWETSDIEGLDACLELVARYDQALATVADRDAVEVLLGDRACLLGTHGWLATLPEGVVQAGAPEVITLLPEVALDGSPSDRVVQEYLGHGTWRHHVEGLAARSPAFAAELAACFDTLAEMKEERSLVARLWRAQLGSAPAASPTTYEVDSSFFALAAAGHDEGAPEGQLIALGPLPDFPAEASLEVSAGRVTLFVFASAPLARVQLGGAASDGPDEGQRWSVATALAPGPLPIRIVAADGRSFEQRLHLAVSSP
jgi:hypothetical protein